MIRIVIAEDQKMLRGAFASLLNFEDDIEVVAEVPDGQRAWDAIRQHQPDVCLLDIEMPHISGLGGRIHTTSRSALQNHDRYDLCAPGLFAKAMDTQVEGYLLKDEPIDFLIEAIRRVMKGERVVSTDLAAALFMKEENPLSEREIEMLLQPRKA